MGGIGSKTVKKIFWIIIFLSVSGVALVFAVKSGFWSRGENAVSLLPDGAGLTVKNIVQTSTKDGKTKWRLTAAQARYDLENNTATLTDVAVTFFLDDGSEVQLKAHQGVLDTKTLDMTASGGVTVVKQDLHVATESLRLYQEQGRLVTDGPVTVTAKGILLTADSLEIDINRYSAVFEGNVEGNIDQTLPL